MLKKGLRRPAIQKTFQRIRATSIIVERVGKEHERKKNTQSTAGILVLGFFCMTPLHIDATYMREILFSAVAMMGSQHGEFRWARKSSMPRCLREAFDRCRHPYCNNNQTPTISIDRSEGKKNNTYMLFSKRLRGAEKHTDVYS